MGSCLCNEVTSPCKLVVWATRIACIVGIPEIYAKPVRSLGWSGRDYLADHCPGNHENKQYGAGEQSHSFQHAIFSFKFIVVTQGRIVFLRQSLVSCYIVVNDWLAGSAAQISLCRDAMISSAS